MARELLTGLIPAAFTPLHDDQTLRLDLVPKLVDQAIEDGVSGFYVCGSTGEGPLLTSEERRQTAEAYVKAAAGRVPVIVQVGHDSLFEARELAQHAEAIGAAGVATLPPTYFKCPNLDVLIQWITEIAAAAPSLPFYYYYIPSMSGQDFSMVQLLEKAPGQIPNFSGAKYSATDLAQFHSMHLVADGRYSLFYGTDEMMLSAYAVGTRGFVGSTYNFAAPLYLSVQEAYRRGDVDEARELQAKAVRMIDVFKEYGGLPAIKAMMKIRGIDCGPIRLPFKTLNDDEVASLKADLEKADAMPF